IQGRHMEPIRQVGNSSTKRIPSPWDEGHYSFNPRNITVVNPYLNNEGRPARPLPNATRSRSRYQPTVDLPISPLRAATMILLGVSLSLALGILLILFFH